MSWTPTPDAACEYKREGGLGGWRKASVIRVLDGGRKVEVQDGREKHVLRAGRVRAARDLPKVVHTPFKPRNNVEALALGMMRTAAVVAGDPDLADRYMAHAAVRARPKRPEPTRSEDYKAFVRRHPCVGCRKPADEAHHFGPRGMGEKCSDLYCVPLCMAEHKEFHDTGAIQSLYDPRLYETERAATEAAFFRAQRDLLIEWLEAGSAM